MCKRFAASSLVVLMILLSSVSVFASAYATWGEIATEMEILLNEGYQAYSEGNTEEAIALVDEAYFGFYEKEGFERATLSYISGQRATDVEYQFSIVKKEMTDGADKAQVRESFDVLIKWLNEDASQLDGEQESAVGVFTSSLLILVREGFEAILIIGAIAAYLIKTGNKDKTKVVYLWSIAAIVASVAFGVAMQTIFNISGASQEIIEGVTMLIAVVVLIFVSNWMIGKAEADAWKKYIDNKVESSIAKGSMVSLGLVAFLSVFREGAETVLFYQALWSDTEIYHNMIFIGFGVAILCLVVIFAVIRYGSMKMPLKTFFTFTSTLLYAMAIIFAGNGVKELQEASVISVTPVPFIQSHSLLGIYPTVETLVPQIILIILAVFTFVYQHKKAKNKASQV